jgi:hypothetical protein
MQQPPKLLDRLRAAIRVRHFSPRTEETYVAWAKRFIFFHGKRHPASMGAEEVNAFLSSPGGRWSCQRIDAESGVECSSLLVQERSR